MASLLFAGAAAVLATAAGATPAGTRANKHVVKSTNQRIEPKVFSELSGRARNHPVGDLATFERLTAHLSHEFRTPLNAVLGFSELMSQEALGPMAPAYSAYARDIHASGRWLLKSTEDALAITALLTAPNRKDADARTCLASALEEAIDFHAAELTSREIAVAIDIPATRQVAIDAQTLRQICINLVADALPRMRIGSTLEIAVRSEAACSILTIRVCDAAAQQPLRAEETFTLLLARTLCELWDARLSTTAKRSGTQEWQVAFDAAAQHDLFN